MKFKKTGAENTTITRDVKDIVEKTGNVYQSLAILVKRSEQINEKMKTELLGKLNEFATHTDELEEVFENSEQIEVSKFYERLPKKSRSRRVEKGREGTVRHPRAGTHSQELGGWKFVCRD